MKPKWTKELQAEFRSLVVASALKKTTPRQEGRLRRLQNIRRSTWRTKEDDLRDKRNNRRIQRITEKLRKLLNATSRQVSKSS